MMTTLSRISGWVVLGSFLLMSCSSAVSPAAPPAPPQEVPALSLPQDLSINLDKVIPPTNTPLTALTSSNIAPPQPIEGGVIANSMSGIIDQILATFRDLKIPIDSRSSFETEFDSASGPSRLSFHFEPFDLDKDGVPEPCSGNTLTAPVCIRMTVDDQLFLAGVFDVPPTASNPGSGRFRINAAADPNALTGETLLIGVRYNEEKAEDRLLEIFVIGRPSETSEETLNLHFLVTQKGPTETAFKTVDAFSKIEDVDALARVAFAKTFTDSEVIYLAGFKESEDQLAVSLDNQPYQCFRISTLTEDSIQTCSDSGVVPTDLAPLPPSTLADVGYSEGPIDFCPTDPDKTEPGICGCGVSDIDSDGDGIADCNDLCPGDSDKSAPGICGCGISDGDSDGDGVPNCLDLCPIDPLKTEPGICGCGIPDCRADCEDASEYNDDEKCGS